MPGEAEDPTLGLLHGTKLGPGTMQQGTGSVGHTVHLVRPLGPGEELCADVGQSPSPRVTAEAPEDSGNCCLQIFGGRTHSQWPSGCPSGSSWVFALYQSLQGFNPGG